MGTFRIEQIRFEGNTLHLWFLKIHCLLVHGLETS